MMWDPYIAGALSLFSGLSTQFLNPFFVSLRLWSRETLEPVAQGKYRGALALLTLLILLLITQMLLPSPSPHVAPFCS